MFKRLVQSGKEILTKESSSILSAAAIIMEASLGSALLELIRTRLLISYFYADKAVVDVFWAAFRLPDMVFQIIIVGALSSAFIPVFSRFIGNRDEENTIASSMINAVMIVMIIFSMDGALDKMENADVANISYQGFYFPVSAIAFIFLANRAIKRELEILKMFEKLKKK